MTLQDIDNLALLARIEMSQAEKEEFLANMESILGYINQVQTANVDEVVYGTDDLQNVMREDENPYPAGLFTEKILAEAPETQDGFIKVKQIIG